jgi:hypothetical protein
VEAVATDRSRMLQSKAYTSWINTLIDRYFDALHTCLSLSLPQKDTQLTVSRAHLEEHIQTTKIHVSRKFVELVFNLDELVSVD